MATYRFGNGRNVSKKYAFKFEVIGELISDFWNPLVSQPPKVWNGFALKSGASARFVGQTEDEMTVSVFNIEKPENASRFRFSFNPDVTSLYNPQTNTYSVQLWCRSKFLDARFDIELADGIDVNDPEVELRNSAQDDVATGGDAFYYRKAIKTIDEQVSPEEFDDLFNK
jgi:hypothetical protein